MEQRYQAVLEVLNDGCVGDGCGPPLRGDAPDGACAGCAGTQPTGLAGLADGSAKPLSCPHQMTPEVEARIVEMRREHPGWGPRTILHQLEPEGVVAVAGVGRRSIGVWSVTG